MVASAPHPQFRERDGVLFRPGESFEPFVSPSQALQGGLLSERKQLHVLQNRVHYALGDYLNGGKPHSLDLAASILSAREVVADADDPLDVISSYYENVRELLPEGSADEEVEMTPFRAPNYDANELERELQSLATAIREIDDLLFGAYLHGSFGDGQYVRNYSDVDVMLIVSRKALTDRAALEKLREQVRELNRYYYYVDPHQHHGTMIAAEPDLRAYNRAYLPPVALSQGRTLLGEEEVRFRVRSDRLERRHGFWRVLQTLRRCVVEGCFPTPFDEEYLTDDGKGPLYCFKHFTSLVLLLPSLYATACGTPVYKANSFDLEIFEHGPEALDVVRRCSAVRRRYPEAVSFQRGEEYRTALAHNPERARRKNQRRGVPPEFWETLGEDYFESALRAAEFLWTQIQ